LKEVILNIVTLERAKQQLNIDLDDTYDDDKINNLIAVAIGLVVSDLNRDVYEKAAEVPENADSPLVIESLNPHKKSNFQIAVLLQLGTLWQCAESEQEKQTNTSKAYLTAIKPLKKNRVALG
jgi:Phage QLRG family, putative DNA packaging.